MNTENTTKITTGIDGDKIAWVLLIAMIVYLVIAQ